MSVTSTVVLIVAQLPFQLVDPTPQPLPGSLNTVMSTFGGQAKTFVNAVAVLVLFFTMAKIAWRAHNREPLTDGIRPVLVVVAVLFGVANGVDMINGLGF